MESRETLMSLNWPILVGPIPQTQNLVFGAYHLEFEIDLQYVDPKQYVYDCHLSLSLSLSLSLYIYIHIHSIFTIEAYNYYLGFAKYCQLLILNGLQLH